MQILIVHMNLDCMSCIFKRSSNNLQSDQLYSNYGHKSNEELLLGYGFVLEPNTADYFSVSLGLEACSAAGALPDRIKWLKTYGMIHATAPVR